MKNQLLVARSFGRSLRRAALAVGLCAAAFASLAATPARASDSQFMGLWFNIDSATRGIVRFQIAGSPGSLGVHVYGACSPTPCDWSVAGLTTYGNNVSDTNHNYATAVYNFGFKTTLLTFQLIDPTTIVVHSYDKFNDGSGRQNYHDREIFRKLLIDPIPFPLPFPRP